MSTRTITLTNRPPVSINEDLWPEIAEASAHDGGEFECQANRTGSLRVRQHADGRTIVYGKATSNWQGVKTVRVGRLLPAGADLLKAIREVSEELGWDLAQECIADLPAEEI